MNWLPIQYQTMRAIRRLVGRTQAAQAELYRMRSAFGAGVVPKRVEYSDGRLWVSTTDHRPGFLFTL